MNAGERAARERVEAVYAAADRLTPEDIQAMVVPYRDADERDALLAEVDVLAGRLGRAALLVEARTRLRDALDVRAVSRVYTDGAMARLPTYGRIEELAQAVLALEDAVPVAVTEDLLRPADAATLADPGRRLLGLERLDGSPAEAGPDTPAVAWEPSPDDWAEAGAGPAAVRRGEPMPGLLGMRAAFFTVAAIVGVPAVLALAAASGEVLLGVLGAAGVVALCWTFATYRSARG